MNLKKLRIKRPKRWMKLDNAAKIFPSNSDKKDPKVFRFACELNEEVNPEILQQALEKSLEKFRGYLTVLKHGFFWYYLEATDMRPEVREEYQPACAPIYDPDVPSLLFEVTYFKKRINLEVFHVLADGTGAVEFLKAIVCHYLIMAHPEHFGIKPEFPELDSSMSERMADSFQKYYDPKKKKSRMNGFAYKIKGQKLAENRIKFIEGIMPVDRLLALARQKKTTITILLTAILIRSIFEIMPLRERTSPITISVPVNLRNHFQSDSVRNFFVIIYVTYTGTGDMPELEEIINAVEGELHKGMEPERLEENMSTMIGFEKNAAIRAIPLAIKDLGLRIAYNFTDLSVTAALSNIGVVKLPEIYSEFINLFDVMSNTKKIQVCMCSYKNNMVVNFADKFVSSDIQKNFFRALTDMDIPIEIATNPLDRFIRTGGGE